MFYKITNKDSKLYKKLHELRAKELEIEKSNNEAVRNVVGNDWDDFLGQGGQQNYWRVTQYTGFAFKHPDRLPQKTWKQHKEHSGIYVPDTRTKNGKMIEKFLNELPHSSIHDVFKILGCELGGRFTFPFVEIGKDGVIVVYMSDHFDSNLRNFNDLVEITSREFEQLTEGGEE